MYEAFPSGEFDLGGKQVTFTPAKDGSEYEVHVEPLALLIDLEETWIIADGDMPVSLGKAPDLLFEPVSGLTFNPFFLHIFLSAWRRKDNQLYTIRLLLLDGIDLWWSSFRSQFYS